LKGANEAKVRQAAENFAQVIKKVKGPFEVLGPTPSPLAKIQNKYRWQILLKVDKRWDPSGKIIRTAVLQAEKLFREEFKTRGIQIAVDVDPVSLI
jgi:primosomal protein N' (replication factor Y)